MCAQMSRFLAATCDKLLLCCCSFLLQGLQQKGVLRFAEKWAKTRHSLLSFSALFLVNIGEFFAVVAISANHLRGKVGETTSSANAATKRNNP
jgi:hypothetical protein